MKSNRNMKLEEIKDELRLSHQEPEPEQQPAAADNDTPHATVQDPPESTIEGTSTLPPAVDVPIKKKRGRPPKKPDQHTPATPTASTTGKGRWKYSSGANTI
ncbi:hypothetical protein RJT34_24572 [Clitoria ternatea]|uniref:Uncharacterized protein n=1 Tax=Clitoria ternatea TaxID=43366 RepID=A0AAN9II47_CLITE